MQKRASKILHSIMFIAIEDMRIPTLNDKFRSGMIAPHSKCRIRRIKACTNWNGKIKN